METAYHTLVEYQEWGEPRRHLMAAIEVGVLSLSNIIAAMLGSEGAWNSAVSICEQIMLVKLCLKLRIGTGSGLEPSRSSRPGNEVSGLGGHSLCYPLGHINSPPKIFLVVLVP